MPITLAVDAMGGDAGVEVTIPAVLEFLRMHEEASVVLVGQQDVIRARLAALRGRESVRLQLEHADEVVAMDESPVSALKNKKNSSMRVAANLVKEGRAQAFVSAGNTGALMAISRFC